MEDQSGLDLDRLLGGQKPSLLSRGLGVLPAESLRQLLLHPRLLLDLQELVLREGGPYWDTMTPNAEHSAHVQRGAEALQTLLARQRRRLGWEPAHGNAGISAPGSSVWQPLLPSWPRFLPTSNCDSGPWAPASDHRQRSLPPRGGGTRRTLSPRTFPGPLF